MRGCVLLTMVLVAMSLGCGVSGHYMSSGPCKGFHTNPQACQRAADNALAISQVKMGQTIEQVSKIMGRGPDRREGTTEAESWSYLTDYDAELMTTIVFRQGVVTEIKQTKWLPEEDQEKPSGGV